MEGVDVLQAWEAIEDCLEFLGECLCGVFDLSGVESPDSGDFEARSDLRGQSPLRSTEDDIDEFLRRGHRCDLVIV